MKFTPLFLLMATIQLLSGQPTQIPLERHGVLVVEAEDTEIVAPWIVETRVKDYSGSGFITWKGENLFSKHGVAVLTYPVFIINPGTYYLLLRNYHDNPDHTEANDVFIRVNDGEWIKTYSHDINKWSWHSAFDINHLWGILPRVNLNKGLNHIYFSGRSTGFSIDRFVLVVPEKLNQEEWKELTASEKVERSRLISSEE